MYVCATHATFSDNQHTMRLLEESPIDEIVIMNTLPKPPNTIAKITRLSVAPLLAHVIWVEHFKNSLVDEEYAVETL